MYLIQKAGKGDGMKEYLTDTEKDHLKKSQPSYLAYLNSHKLENTGQNMQDYLNEVSNHEPAKITGGLAKTFGLDYKVNGAVAFSKMLNGQFPGTEEDFKKIYGESESGMPVLRKGNRVIKQSTNAGQGNSMVLALPRSFSMAYALLPPQEQKKLRACVDSADVEITKEIERLTRPSNKDYITKQEAQEIIAKGGEVDPKRVYDNETTQCAFFEFYHYENRGVEPHLHKHKEQMPYAEFTMADGSKKILAIDNKDVLVHQKELTANFNTLVVNKLESAGMRCESAKEHGNGHTFQVAGISRKHELEISSRRKEMLEKLGKDDGYEKSYIPSVKQFEARSMESYRQRTAKDKDGHSADKIHEIIKSKTEDVMGIIGLIEFDRKQKEHRRFHQPFELKNITNSKEMSLSGEMSEANIKATISNELRFSRRFDNLSQIKEAVNDEYQNLIDTNQLIFKDNGKITSMEVVKNEYKALGYALRLQEHDKRVEHQLPDEQYKKNFGQLKKFYEETQKAKKPLNAGQLQSCHLITKEKKILSITGYAGTGKTSSVIRFANKFYSENGNEVIGLATQAKTGKALGDAGIKNCSSIAKLLVRYTNKATGELDVEKVKEEFNNKTVIIDESGMVGSADYAKLLQMVHDGMNNNIVLVGDTNQLTSVSAGNSLACINQYLDKDHQATLWQNTRQKNDVAKGIAEAFLAKDSQLAVDIMKKNDLLVLTNGIETRQDLIGKIANDYMNSGTEKKVAIAYTNEDCNALNDEIRSRLFAADKLDKDNQHLISVNRKNSNERDERPFTINDKIIFTAPTKLSKTEQIMNADQGVIKGFKQQKKGLYMEVEINGRVYSINTDEHKNFNSAYAITSYSSQGLTVDEAFVLADSTMNNNTAYVDFSRHEHEVKMYCETNELQAFIKNSAIAYEKPTTIGDKNVQEVLGSMDYYERTQFKNDCGPADISQQQGRGKAEQELTPFSYAPLKNDENFTIQKAMNVISSSNKNAGRVQVKPDTVDIDQQKSLHAMPPISAQKTIAEVIVLEDVRQKKSAKDIRAQEAEEMAKQLHDTLTMNTRPKRKGLGLSAH